MRRLFHIDRSGFMTESAHGLLGLGAWRPLGTRLGLLVRGNLSGGGERALSIREQAIPLICYRQPNRGNGFA